MILTTYFDPMTLEYNIISIIEQWLVEPYRTPHADGC